MLACMQVKDPLKRTKPNLHQLEVYPGPVVGRACPKCNGWLFLEQWEYGHQLKCLNCGWVKE